jgi:tape measure domain-containing protein
MAGVEYVISLKDRFSGTLNKLNAQTKRLDTNMKSLNSSISGTSVVVAGLATAFAGVKVLKLAGEFEQTQIAFEVMLGSIEKGTKLLKDLGTFATKTPFSLKGVEQNAKLLLAVGIEAEKIIPTMKSLGDVAAGLNVPLDRLALNFGQIKSQGKLTGRELRDFSVAGVPLIAELSKNLGKNSKEITEMVSAGKIGFKDVSKAFDTMSSSGGRFNNLMGRLNKTFLGQVNELTENFQILGREIGGALIPIIRPLVLLLSRMAKWMQENKDTVRILTKVIAGMVIGMTALVAITKSYAAILAVTALLDPFRLIIVSVSILIGLMVVFRKNVAEALDVISIGFKVMGATLKNHFLGIIDTVQLQWLRFSKTVNETIRNLDQVAKIEEKINSILKEGSTRGVDLDELRKKQREAQLTFGKGIFGTTEKVKDTASEIAKGLGLTAGGGEGDLSLSNQTTVTSAAPKVFNINIEKLVESFKIETTNMVEGAEKTKEAITSALIGALADVQTA